MSSKDPAEKLKIVATYLRQIAVCPVASDCQRDARLALKVIGEKNDGVTSRKKT